MRLPLTASDRLSPVTRGLLLFAAFNSLLVPLVLVGLKSLSWNDGVLQETYGNLSHARQEGDSWGPMLEAFDYTREPHPKPLYTKIFFSRRVKFQYPPSALLPLRAIAEVCPQGSWLGALNALSLLSLALSVFLALFILARGLRAAGSGADPAVDAVARHAAALTLALGFYPLVKAYSLGQVQTWLNGLFALALWCWLTSRPALSGALVGSMCLVKPHYALFLVWGALRGRWAFALSLLATLLGGLALSLALFGLANHVDYLQVLSYMSRRGEAYYPNQSMNGLLNRLLLNGNIMDWRGASFAPYHPVVFLGTAITSVLLILLALALPGKPEERGGAADFCVLGLASTLASPIAWEHHYGILLPVYAVALPPLMRRRVLGRATIPLFALSFFLSSNYFGVANRLAYTRWNVLQSSLYLGALLLLVCLHRLRTPHGTPGPAAARR